VLEGTGGTSIATSTTTSTVEKPADEPSFTATIEIEQDPLENSSFIVSQSSIGTSV
jgi:hypothetical protein